MFALASAEFLENERYLIKTSSNYWISSIKWNVICFHIISQIQRSIAVNQNIDNISKTDQKSSLVS